VRYSLLLYAPPPHSARSASTAPRKGWVRACRVFLGLLMACGGPEPLSADDLQQQSPHFANSVRDGRVFPRVLITIGGLESQVPEVMPKSWGPHREFIARANRQDRMVDNARNLASRSKQLKGKRGQLVCDYAAFPDESHVMAGWSALIHRTAFASAEAS
jgi:hypothetical protein